MSFHNYLKTFVISSLKTFVIISSLNHNTIHANVLELHSYLVWMFWEDELLCFWLLVHVPDTHTLIWRTTTIMVTKMKTNSVRLISIQCSRSVKINWSLISHNQNPADQEASLWLSGEKASPMTHPECPPRQATWLPSMSCTWMKRSSDLKMWLYVGVTWNVIWIVYFTISVKQKKKKN